MIIISPDLSPRAASQIAWVITHLEVLNTVPAFRSAPCTLGGVAQNLESARFWVPGSVARPHLGARASASGGHPESQRYVRTGEPAPNRQT